MIRCLLMLPLALMVQSAAATSFLPSANDLQPVQARATTTDWAAVLGSYVRFCQTAAQPQYYVDCLSERFGFIAAAMGPYDADTAILRQILLATARDLGSIATKYHTPAAGEASPQSGRITTTRPLRAIAPQNRSVAAAVGTDVLNATELVLLRSATRDPARGLVFTQVAEVIGTAKVLLRAT